jgi:hypothetical protein
VRNQRLAFLLILLLPGTVLADLPKAISVAPMAVAPGQTTTVSVNGLNLAGATELWTNLEADVHRVEASGEQIREIPSAFSAGPPPPGTMITEAEAFARGKIGKNGPFVLNGNFSPNYAEWDFELPEPGRFVLELNYASGESRPVKLFLNGQLLKENAAAGKTGGFADSNSKWMVECVLELRKGVSTVRLERPGGMPHFDKLALVPTELPATRFANVTPTDRVAPFEIAVPKNSPIGIRGLRVATREGISNLLLYMVDDLPTVNEIRSANSDGNAQSVELPVAIEGYCDVGLADRYQFHAMADEAISIEVIAARVGSRLDPVIRLLDSDGMELAFVDDSAGLAGDCCLRHRFEIAGDYVVTIEDSLMGGASGHRYRLRMGDFPLISMTVPAAIQKGTSTSLNFAGLATDGLRPLNVAGAKAESLLVSSAFPGKIGSGFCEVAVTKSPQVVAGVEATVTVPIPGGVSGVLSRPGEHHSCHMDVKKGDRIRIRDASRSKGVPAVLAIAVRGESNRRLAEIRKAGSVGRELIWSAPADGVFELEIADLTGRGGPEFGYHVELTRERPDFQIRVEQDSTILPKNGYAILKVVADRAKYNGPISLTVSGLGDDVRLLNDVIPEKAKDTRLKIYLPQNYQPGQTRPIEITGTATIDGQPEIRKASTLAALRKAHPQTPFPPGDLDGLIAATVGSEIPDFFALSLDNNAILFPRLVGEVYFTVRVKDRAKGFKDPVNIRIEGLPAGFSAGGGERAVSRSENNEYRFQLNGPKDLPPGDRPIRVVGEASFKGQTKEIELASLPLKIIEPLLLSVVADGPLIPGSRRTLKIQAQRFVPRAGGDKKQIDVEFSSVPAGVTLPKQVVIPAGKSETTAELSIGPSVDVATLRSILATARTVVAGSKVATTASISERKTE